MIHLKMKYLLSFTLKHLKVIFFKSILTFHRIKNKLKEVWGNMMVNRLLQNFHFGVNYPYLSVKCL